MVKRLKLNEKTLREAEPKPGVSYQVFDTEVIGFSARVQASGARTFTIDYRHAGRQRRMNIGRWPEWSVTAARERAKELRRAIDEGNDPLAAKEEFRGAPRVKDMIDRYIAEHLPKLAKTNAGDQISMLKKMVEPASDVDGNAEGRRGTVPMFDGPPPMVMACTDADHECRVVGNWISERLREGCAPSEVGVFVRSDAELKRARSAVKSAGARAVELNDKVEVEDGAVAISTMHFAKGLEFRSVVVMACDDDVIPQSDRIESVADDADLEEVYNTERHLLYVACTRARDHLLVTGITPVSEFVDDFLKSS